MYVTASALKWLKMTNNRINRHTLKRGEHNRPAEV